MRKFFVLQRAISLFIITLLFISKIYKTESYEQFTDAMISSIKQIRTTPIIYQQTVSAAHTSLKPWLSSLSQISDITQVQGLNHLAAYIANRQKNKNWVNVDLTFPQNLYQFMNGFQTPYNLKAVAGRGFTQGRRFLDASLEGDNQRDFYRNTQHTSIGAFCACLLDYNIFCVIAFSAGKVVNNDPAPILSYINENVPHSGATCPSFTLPAITWQPPDNVLDCLPNAATKYYQLAEDSFIHQNHARLYPLQWVDYLNKQQFPFFRSLKYYPYDGSSIITTVQGGAAVTDAIEDLVKQPSLKGYQWDSVLATMAKEHVQNQGIPGLTGHNSPTTFQSRVAKYFKSYSKIGENIAYGLDTGVEQIAGLIIDDDHFQNDGHRYAIYDGIFTHVGVACGCHRVYGVMCVYNFGAQMVPNDAFVGQSYQANSLALGVDQMTNCGSISVTYSQYNGPVSSTPPRCRNQQPVNLNQTSIKDEKEECAAAGVRYEVIALIFSALLLII